MYTTKLLEQLVRISDNLSPQNQGTAKHSEINLDSSINMSSTKPDPHADDPLPPGWLRQYSKSQKRNFYFHKETKHTQWHFPTASEAKDPLKAKQRAEANKERELKKQQDVPPKRDRKEPPPASSSSLSSPAENPAASKRPRTDDLLDLDKTSVAIIVPFRDIHAAQKRSVHLREFIPHMIRFLGRLQNQENLISDYHIYIIEQSDDQRKFNRGKLLNIGYDLARKSGRKHDVFIFHDVDLLPLDDLGSWYAMFPKRPIHIARVWGRYSGNPKYFGGVVSFSSSDFKRINGVSLFRVESYCVI